MFQVAIIEDNELLAKTIHRALADVGIESDLFHSTSEADSGIGAGEYAALIVDGGLSNGEGFSFLRKLRAAGQMSPCLLLIARGELNDRSDDPECRADDFLTKPFAMDELVARLRRLMRRAVSLSASIAESGDITVDPRLHAMRCAHRSVQLARAELEIMLCLMKAGDRTVSHAILRHAAWGPGEVVKTNALAVSVHRLRKKLAAVGTAHRLASIRGVGFVLLAPAALADVTRFYAQSLDV